MASCKVRNNRTFYYFLLVAVLRTGKGYVKSWYCWFVRRICSTGMLYNILKKRKSFLQYNFVLSRLHKHSIGLVRMTSDVETNIVAVERIKEYGETPQVIL